MSLRAAAGNVRRQLLCTFHQRRVSLGDVGPVISFTFDDFPRTAMTAGGAILESFGLRGTYYVAMDLMNRSNELGEHFRRSDLDELINRGHELGSHTFHHLSARSSDGLAFRKDALRGRDELSSIAGRSAQNFAYPFGELRLATKRCLEPEMSSCRGIFPGIHHGVVDLNLLRANSLYGDMPQLAAATNLIAHNREGRGWLVFYTHDVCEHPSPYGCTSELLQAVVLEASRSARIMTVSAVVDQIIPNSHLSPHRGAVCSL